MKNKIIYSIDIEDVQNVANEELSRELSKEELFLVERKLGNYIDWYEAINITIHDVLREIQKVK